MAFPVGTPVPQLDPAVTHLDVNSATTALLASAAMDAESKVTIPAAIFADLSFRGQLNGIAAAGAAVHVYRKDLLADGTNDADTPTLSNKRIYIGSFVLPVSLAASTNTTIKLPAVPMNMSGECKLYFENATGRQINAGWVVTVTNISYIAQA